jgi:hypothetical protein
MKAIKDMQLYHFCNFCFILCFSGVYALHHSITVIKKGMARKIQFLVLQIQSNLS